MPPQKSELINLKAAKALGIASAKTNFLVHALNSSGKTERNGAAYRIRTYDPVITNDVLYQLS